MVIRLRTRSFSSIRVPLLRPGRGLLRLTDFTSQELTELDQVSAVAFHGVVAEVFFQFQVFQELANQR